MLKRIVLIISSILVILSIFFGYRYLKNQQVPDYDVFRLIPLDAALIVESEDFIDKIEEIRKENKIWQELLSFPAVEQFDKDLEYISDLTLKNEIVQSIIEDNHVIASAHQLGKEDIGFLIFVKLRNTRDKKLLLETVTGALSAQGAIQKRDYNGVNIYNVQNIEKEIYFSFFKGVFIYSSKSLLVENAIRQSEAEISILNDKGFNKVQKTAGKNVDANVYLNFSKLNEIISFTLNDQEKARVSAFKNFANWAELDINLKDDAVLLNGFTFSADSLNNYLNIFLRQEPVDHELKTILPTNTSLFLSLGVSNTERYIKDYKSYLEKQGKINNYQLTIDRYKNKYAIDLESFFKSNLDEELGIIITDEPNNNMSANSFIAMRTRGKSLTEDALNDILTKVAQIKGVSKENYISSLRIDKETTYKVYSIPFQSVFKTFFGHVFPAFDYQYATFIDNFLIIGSSKKSVANFIHSNVLQKTLENDMKFEQFTNYLSSKSNFYFYTNMFRSPGFIAEFLKPSLKKDLLSNIETFKKFQAFAVQFQQNNDMIYNNLFLQYVPEIKEEAVTVWESHLDTSINFKPVLVTNHYTKENEIFVQDLNNKIYLINKVGRILWKLQLNEEINSEIYQVDYYKNGKLQLLFSTKGKLHCIDRNGNYVERYPVKLRSEASTGMALFDYDKNMNYRILVPCKNKNVYLYNIEGSLVNGWKFGQTDGHVTTSVQYFRVKTKDYLVFADDVRVYILNRRGEERIQVKDQFSKSVHNPFMLESGESEADTRFVTTDSSGLVRKIALNGEVVSKQVGTYSVNHYFDYQDIDADGFNDYIFLDNDKLEVIKQNGSKIFDYKFDQKIESSPVYYYFSYDDRKIGVVSRTTNEIYLFNSNGSIYEGFPLKGNTAFTIGYLESSHNQFNLIVGTKYNFLYNYSVN
ncbi:MAG: DUF3352 domain-containing protein [Bacteroidetes bacterium]|nr:DUF3352 domain-containing protein [Bacteroidota bacterium]